jgi:flagellar biogenesis protein FliO
MAHAPPCDRLVSARTRAHGKTSRARVAVVVVLALVAWWAQPVAAQGGDPESRPLGSSVESATSQPTPASSSMGVMDAVRTGAALVVVLGLIGGAWWWLRRSGFHAGTHGGAFEIVARHAVGRGQQVVVARFGPRVLCLQQTRDGLRTLCELSSTEDVDSVLAQARAGDHHAAVRNSRKLPTVDVRGKTQS